MLKADQIQRYRRDGFVLGGQLLPESQVDQLRAELDRVIARHDRGHAGQVYVDGTAAFCQRRDCFLQVTNLRELSEPFRAVVESPALTRMAAQLLDASPLRVFADAMLFKNGVQSAVNAWHQDGPAFDILHEPDRVATAWIALDDVGPDDGPVCFAPGSHTWTDDHFAGLDRAQRLLDDDANQPAADRRLYLALMNKGDVHFHHGRTWHCSLQNQTGRPRRGFVVNYMPASVRYRASGGHYLKAFVRSADGEALAGEHFPVVTA
jgi:ectoine hydroxylase-related dioxygenase (phytanoyl-CoA dioxygenase family)